MKILRQQPYSTILKLKILLYLFKKIASLFLKIFSLFLGIHGTSNLDKRAIY